MSMDEDFHSFMVVIFCPRVSLSLLKSTEEIGHIKVPQKIC
jgi:hypothetical protein